MWVLIGYFSLIGHRSVFDWCVVRCEPKTKHAKGICIKEINLRLQIESTTPHSVMNTIEGAYVSN